MVRGRKASLCATSRSTQYTTPYGLFLKCIIHVRFSYVVSLCKRTLHAILFHAAHVIIHWIYILGKPSSHPVNQSPRTRSIMHHIHTHTKYLRRIHRKHDARRTCVFLARNPRTTPCTHSHALPKPKYIYKPIIDQHNSSGVRCAISAPFLCALVCGTHRFAFGACMFV